MGYFATQTNFSSRSQYAIRLQVTTSYTEGGTVLSIYNVLVKHTYINNSPASTGSPRSYSVTNGRFPNLTSDLAFSSDNDSALTFSFTFGNENNFVEQIFPIWGASGTFTRFVRNSDATGTVTVGASHSLLGSASASVAVKHVYRTTFDANGGTVGTSSTDQDSGASISLPTPTRSGYNFLGWVSGSTNYGSGTYTVNATRALVASWETASYTVTLDANGGSVTTSTYTVNPGSSVTLASPTWSGKTFVGWYTSSTYGQGSFANSFYTPTGSITLYARWEYAVEFDANEGTNGTTAYVGVNPSTGAALSTVTSPSSTRTGFTFRGWHNSSGTFQFNANQTFTPTANITYYAKWEGTVSFNSNSGTAASSIVFVAGTSITLPTTTRTGYSFSGWHTALTGGSLAGGAGATYAPTGTITLFARWAALAVSWSDTSLNLSARKGQPYTINNSVSASYVNSWIVSGVPAGLTFNQGVNINGIATSTLTGSPTVYGPHTISLTPRNVDNVSGQTYTYQIQIADVALSWIGGDQVLASTTATENAQYTDGVSVAAGPTVTYSEKDANSLPPGLTLNPTTGAITGVPTTPNTYDFVIRATNGTGEILDTNTLRLIVQSAGGYVQVKTLTGWQNAIVYVKTNDGWVEGAVNAKSPSGWGPSFSS